MDNTGFDYILDLLLSYISLSHAWKDWWFTQLTLPTNILVSPFSFYMYNLRRRNTNPSQSETLSSSSSDPPTPGQKSPSHSFGSDDTLPLLSSSEDFYTQPPAPIYQLLPEELLGDIPSLPIFLPTYTEIYPHLLRASAFSPQFRHTLTKTSHIRLTKTSIDHIPLPEIPSLMASPIAQAISHPTTQPTATITTAAAPLGLPGSLLPGAPAAAATTATTSSTTPRRAPPPPPPVSSLSLAGLVSNPYYGLHTVAGPAQKSHRPTNAATARPAGSPSGGLPPTAPCNPPSALEDTIRVLEGCVASMATSLSQVAQRQEDLFRQIMTDATDTRTMLLSRLRKESDNQEREMDGLQAYLRRFSSDIDARLATSEKQIRTWCADTFSRSTATGPQQSGYVASTRTPAPGVQGTNSHVPFSSFTSHVPVSSHTGTATPQTTSCSLSTVPSAYTVAPSSDSSACYGFGCPPPTTTTTTTSMFTPYQFPNIKGPAEFAEPTPYRSAQTFLTEYKHYAELLHGNAPDIQAKRLYFFLSGRASHWFRTHIWDQPFQNDPQAVYARFLDRFGREQPQTLLKSYRTRRQARDESVADYINDMILLLGNSGLPETVQVDYLVNGFKPEIRDSVRLEEPKSIHDAEVQALRQEMMLRGVRGQMRQLQAAQAHQVTPRHRSRPTSRQDRSRDRSSDIPRRDRQPSLSDREDTDDGSVPRSSTRSPQGGSRPWSSVRFRSSSRERSESPNRNSWSRYRYPSSEDDRRSVSPDRHQKRSSYSRDGSTGDYRRRDSSPYRRREGSPYYKPKEGDGERPPRSPNAFRRRADTPPPDRRGTAPAQSRYA